MTSSTDHRFRSQGLTSGYDLDNIRTQGIYDAVDPVNGPSAGSFFVVVFESFENSPNDVVIKQIAYDYATVTSSARTFNGTSWGAWSSGGGGGGNTNLTFSRTSTGVTVLSDTGTDAVLPVSSTTLAGVMSAADKLKLDARVFNVMNYGASNNDTNAATTRTAFASAVAACAAVGGGIIYAPAGTYAIGPGGSPSLGGVLLGSNMTLMGDGMGVTIIKCADLGNADMSGLVRTPSGVENSNVTIRDLTLDANKAGQTGWANTVPFFCGVTPGNRTLKDRDIRLINVEAKNGRNGTAGSGHNGNGGYGFDPHEMSDRIYFLNCIAHDNEEDGLILDGCQNFVVAGCQFYNNGRHGFNTSTQTEFGHVVGNRSFDNAINNYLIQQDTHSVVIDGNYSGNSGEQGIRVRRGATIISTKVVVSNNVVENSGRNGINITGSADNVVTNNYIINSSQSANNTYMDVSIDQDDGDTGTFTAPYDNVVKGNTAIAIGTNKSKNAYRENTAAANPPLRTTFLWNTARGQVNDKYSAVSVTSAIVDEGYGNVYYAVSFGVLASNADNGAALRALATKVSAAGGGTIILPPGTILASGTGTASQGVINLPDNVHLKGQGIDVTILTAINPVNSSIQGVVRTTSGGTNVGNVISDMTITSQACTGTGDVEILRIGGTSDDGTTCINLKLTNGQSGSGNAGYGLRTTSGTVNAKIIDVEASSCERDGFYIDSCNKVSLSRPRATGNGRHGINVNAANETVIEHAVCSANVSNNVFVDSSFNTQILGGTFLGGGVGLAAIRIVGPGSASASYTTVKGAMIKNAQRAGVEIVGSDYNNVSDCTFLDNGLLTNNVYSDVSIDIDGGSITSNFNTVTNCVMRATQANKTKFAVNETATNNNNHAYWNRFAGQTDGNPITLVGAASRRWDSNFWEADDSIFTLVGSADRTKKVKFEIDGLTTATTRTVTIPDKNGTMAMLSDLSGGVGFTYNATDNRGQAVNPLEFLVPAALPTVAPTDVNLVYTLKRGNIPMLASVDQFSRRTFLGKHPGFQVVGAVIGGASTLSASGVASTSLGTIATPSYATATRAQATKRSTATTTAATTQSAGVRISSNCLVRGAAAGIGGYMVSTVFSISTIDATNTRGFVGVSSADVPIVGAPSATALACFGVGFDAAATQWRFISNPAAGTATYTDLGANFPVAANTLYELVVFCKPNDSTLYYSFTNLETGNNATGSITTNIPAAGSFLAPQAVINTGSGTSAIVMDIASVYIETPLM